MLFLAVGALSALSVLVLGISSSVLQEIKLAQRVTDNAVSFPAAASAVEAARLALLGDETPAQVVLGDLAPRSLAVGGVTVSLECSDEQAKIAADAASKETLMRLPGLADNEAVAEAIVSASITTPEDLRLVSGMTDELYAQFADFVTVFADGGVNINTAPAEALAALGMDADLVSKVILYRGGDDGEQATSDDRVFAQPSAVIAALEPYGLSEAQRVGLETLVNARQLETTSHVVTFAAVVTRGARVLGRFTFVKDLDSGAVLFCAQD